MRRDNELVGLGPADTGQGGNSLGMALSKDNKRRSWGGRDSPTGENSWPWGRSANRRRKRDWKKKDITGMRIKTYRHWVRKKTRDAWGFAEENWLDFKKTEATGGRSG